MSDSGRTNILVACFPKSGSTYLCGLLAEITKFPQLGLVQFYGQNEQDLFEPAVKVLRTTDSVTQQHVKATNFNVQLMQQYGLRPVVLVRNIFDVILSVHDHYERECHLGPLGYIHHEYRSMNFEERMWFLIHVHLPWYFNFFASWRQETPSLRPMWMSYEQFFTDQSGWARRILEFYGLSVTDTEIERALAAMPGRFTRLNVGKSGRGAALPLRHREAILRLAMAWRIDRADMHLIGLGPGPAGASELTDSRRAA